MNAFINKIYDMLYSPIITPYNLLENAKLDNYSYVKYYSTETGLVVEMECEVPGEGNRIFYYHFDKRDYLQKICECVDGKHVIVFDRNEAVEAAKEDYYNSLAIVKQVG